MNLRKDHYRRREFRRAINPSEHDWCQLMHLLVLHFSAGRRDTTGSRAVSVALRSVLLGRTWQVSSSEGLVPAVAKGCRDGGCRRPSSAAGRHWLLSSGTADICSSCGGSTNALPAVWGGFDGTRSYYPWLQRAPNGRGDRPPGSAWKDTAGWGRARNGLWFCGAAGE